ncbi:MAG: HMA2 domain-containing protein [Limnoraphis robusta]
MTNTTLQPFHPSIEVVHATSGRVRIKVRGHLETIAQQLRQIEGIYSVILHPQTNNLILKFETQKLSLSELLAQLTVSHCELGNHTISSAETVVLTPTPQPSTEIIEILIRMSAAMLLNRHLGISGWVSLPVSYATSQVTAKVINGVKPQLKAVTLLSSNSQPIEEKNIEITVIHSTPGRIRLRVPKVKKDSRYAKRLERFGEQISGIQKININLTTASVTIIHQFNNNAILESELNRLFEKVAETQPNFSEILASPVPPAEVKVTPLVEDTKPETQVETKVQTVTKKAANSTPKVPEKAGIFSGFKSSMLTMFLNFMAGRPMPQTVS